MANNLVVNPMVVDTTGVIFAKPVKVKGISIRASADAWVVVLDNVLLKEGTPRDGGVKVFDRASSITNDRGTHVNFGEGIVFQGLWATTLTNITSVLIYLA